ncbi:ATP-dependent DNA helicase [Candidatus Symbiothrix dinenymphae]|nr:ATP-dependent DNA helicase [Candidatus Symbiothrix dinenymphae]
MHEKQNIEYKSIWKDEYLRWICGFANAQGGTIFIGKDDGGAVVGVNNAKKLLLDKFLLQKYGRTWDGVPVPHVAVADLKPETFDFFRKKGIKALISYEGIYRVETFEYPKEAIREALHNAVAHKDYSGGYPIQISVYKDRIMIWNYGQLPENWTITDLLEKHSSRPYNPDIANAFFRIGYIESWGRGINKMTEQCIAAGLPTPTYSYKNSDVWVVFRKDILFPEYLKELGLNERQIEATLYTREKGKITNSEYQTINGVSKRTATNELTEMVNKFAVLAKTGTSGSGIFYEIVGQKNTVVGQKWGKKGN